ncbi:hypothetical protein [uncultured Treponema sp.]|uniref:hypothetical protein n=1 Tax=uncultured Treponema sp. TaxID=162155 RepID=UPI0025E1F9FD|nr:hypothetical protein [uncultured Treponema sp.]
MKRRFSFFIFMILCASCFAKQEIDETLLTVGSDVVARCEDKEILAVLSFESETTDMSDYLATQLTALIMENSTLRVVTRQYMDKINEELDYQYSGYVSDATALSLCERLGAQKIIFGQIDELDNAYVLQVKMLDVESGAYALFKKYEIFRSAKTEQLFHHASKIYKSSFGLIFEANKNSISHISPAVGLSFDYNVTRKFSLGIKTIVSYDFLNDDNTIFAFEPLAVFRWYAVSPSGEPSAGLFLEGQGGADMLLVNSELKPVPSAGLAAGYRIAGRKYYFEPTVRGGYPYLFGIGFASGFRF